MISYSGFGKLRLAQFRPDDEITKLVDWEFMDHMWVGEAIGFSEWLRLESEPNVLRSLAIAFSEFPETSATRVLQTIGLAARRGMKSTELCELLGAPTKELRFVRAKDRVTYEFTVAGPPRYNLLCTVLSEGGLTYLVIMVPL